MDFIYDRTQADVDRAKELNSKYISGTITEDEMEEWASSMKGACNASDLNRIEGNTKVLSDFFASPVSVKSWTSAEIPRRSDYLRIINNVKKIRSAWFGLTNTPQTPSQPLNTYQKWNDIERILHDLNYTYQRYLNSFYYCNSEIFAGEGIGDI